MKQYKNKLILTSFITILPVLIGLIFWDKLPEYLPTHFNFAGEADKWSSKIFAVVGLPVVLMVLHVFCIFVTLNDPKKKNIGKNMLSVIFWIIPVCSLVVNGSIILFALGKPVNISLISSILVGLLFIFLGNYMSKNQQNYTVGIRCPWTLSSEKNWAKTHRFASWLYVIGGVTFIINGFVNNYILLAIVLPFVVIAPLIYSFLLYKKES